MDTYLRAGRVVLKTLFSKKDYFLETRYELLKIVGVLPRKVNLCKDEINLEKNYFRCITNAYGKQNHYKIFIWSAELGLTEIILSKENEGRLLDLVCRCVVGPITHIVIAEKFTREQAEEYSSQQKIDIYSLSKEQKEYITSTIATMEKNEFETDSEFTFNHGYFPKK